MTQLQAKARQYYYEGRKSQKEIALELGVSEKTIYNWIIQFSWHKLREAAIVAPTAIADNLCSQIIEFQNSIAARGPGQRFPTPQEINLQCKLINCLDKLKKYPNKGQALQTITSFIHFVDEEDDILAEVIWSKYNEYMHARSDSGYKPYHIESGPIPFVYAPRPTSLDDESITGKFDEEPAHQPENNEPETEMEYQNTTETTSVTASNPLSGPFPPPEKTGNPISRPDRQTPLPHHPAALYPAASKDIYQVDPIINAPLTLPRTG